MEAYFIKKHESTIYDAIEGEIMLREGDKIPRTLKPIIKTVDGKRVPLTFEDIQQMQDNEDRVRELEQELAWTKRRADTPLSFITQFERVIEEYEFYFKADEDKREYDRERAKLELRLLLLAGDDVGMHHATLDIVLDEKGYTLTKDIDEGIEEFTFTTLDEVFDFVEAFWDEMEEYQKEIKRELKDLEIT